LDKRVPAQSVCGNCGANLTGPYCSVCGQHAHESARSISALVHDAWHIAVHVDGRLWQTVYILLLKPGRLTKEYFAERRARYLPPVRLYLVLSVLFFAFGAISPTSLSHAPAESKATADAASAAAENNDPSQVTDREKKDKGFFFNISDCNQVHTSFAWLEKPLQKSCVRNLGDRGAAVRTAFISNIPKMMFVFVPMMALVMLILYWRPRRMYIEHLVFFLHNHAAIFFILLLETFLSWVVLLWGWRAARGWVIAFTTLYTVWYVYRAMRAYYGQGRLLTLTKLGVVGFAYMVGFAVTLLATLILSAVIA
jgi:hypothetical protein